MTYIVYADELLLENMLTASAIYTLITIIDGLKIRFGRICFIAILNSILITATDVIFIDKIIIHHTLYACIYYFSIKKHLNIIENTKFMHIFLYLVAIAAILEYFTSYLNFNMHYKQFAVYALLLLFLYGLFKKNSIYYNSDSLLNEATIYLLSTKIRAITLYDSGNSLFDPYHKAPIIIVDYRLLKSILSDKAYKIIKAYHQSGYFDYASFYQYTNIKAYPISYRTINSCSSILPVIKIDKLVFDNSQNYDAIYAGISQNKLSANNEYTVLLNKNIKPSIREENSND